ncbi:MAG: dihydroorotate dehydrogenase electron transfer subunit [Anaerolineae bacterium]|nr:dihydroorotate dehydrogenase electron transfer subunit [Anaerolineae bacterium]
MHLTYKVISNETQNARTRILFLDRPLPAQPGQFVMVWLPGVGEKPYSVCSDNPLALMVVDAGPVSRALCGLEAGDDIWIRGPFGQGFQIKGEKLLLAGGGYGVAPLLFLARRAIDCGCSVDVCIGAAAAQDVLLDTAFSTAGCSVRIATEDGSLGFKGLVTGLLEAQIHDYRPDVVYACGPTGMLRAVSLQCRSHRIPHQLSWEAHIRCGLGLCGHCECEAVDGLLPSGWLVCQDGPVQIVDYISEPF